MMKEILTAKPIATIATAGGVLVASIIQVGMCTRTHDVEKTKREDIKTRKVIIDSQTEAKRYTVNGILSFGKYHEDTELHQP